ncbi:uncharacterized protein [Clytia hemisphaerica]|uniref:uncharacterized protein n=1 Tax=Clytia hemisphaerica TaxID=252671 RepID=UPI0034D67472
MLDGTPVSPDVTTAPIESLEQMGHVHIDQGTTKFDITKESEKKVILDGISAFSDVDPTSPIDACVPKSESETESNTPVSNGVIGILDSPDIVSATIESPGYINIVREVTPSSLAEDSERKEIKVVTPAFTDVDPDLIKVEMTTTLVSKPSISHEEVSSPTALSLDDVQEDDTDVPSHTEYVNIDVGVTPLTITEDAEVVEDSELVEDPVVPETKNVEQVRRTSENESTTQIIEPDSIVGEDPKIDVGFVKESEPHKVNLICTVEQASEQPKNEDTDLEIQGDITILEVTDTVDSFDEVDLSNMEEFDQIIDDLTIPDCDQDTPDPLTVHNVVVDSPEDTRKNETSKNHVELKKTLLQDQQIVIEEKITVESNTREVFAENDNLLTNTQQSDDSITSYNNREKEENYKKSLHHNNDLITTDGSLLANKSLNTTTVAQDESIKLRSDKEQNYHVKIETGELKERQDNRYDYLSRVSNRDENDSRANEINAQAKQWIEVVEQDDNRPENKSPEVENQEDAVSKEEDHSVKKELISKTRNPTENKHHIEDSTIVTKQKQHSLTNEQVNHSTISQEGFNNQDNPLTHQLDDDTNDFNNGEIEGVVTAARIKEDSTFNREYNPVYIKTEHQKTTTDVLIDSSNILTFDNKNTGLQHRESRLDQRYTEGKPDLLSENIIKENRSEFTVIESSLKNLTDKENGSIDSVVVNDSNSRNNRRGKPLSDKKFETATKRVVGREENSWIRVSADSSESVNTAHQNKVETKVEPESRQKILAINSIVSLKGDSIDFKEYLLKHSDTVFNVRESNEFRGKDLENMTETELIVEPLLDGQESDVIKLKGSLQTVDDLLSGAVSSSNGMGSNQEVMAVIQDAVNEFTADIGSGESRKNISSEVNIVFPHSPSAQKRTISFIFKEDQEQRFHSEIETDIANKSPLASPAQHVSMLSIDDSSTQPGMKRSGSFLSVANVPELNASGKHVDTHAQSDKQWSYSIRQKNEGTCQLSIQVIMDSNILERFETETVEFKNILKNFEHDGCIGEWVLVNCTTREIEIFIQLLKELLEKEKLRELDNDMDKNKFCYIL